MRRRCRLRVYNGYQAVRAILEDYLRLIYQYNSLISGTGFYLKPIHIVTRRAPDGTRRRYVYIGRYWWRISYRGKKGRTSRIQWRYVGKEKPPELRDYPDPPQTPLHGLRFALDSSQKDVIIDCETYQRYSWVFQGLRTEQLQE
jgi:hypothetical protein